MTVQARHHLREARFLGLIALTAALIGLHLAEGLNAARRAGSGHRVIDRAVLERRIDAGDLRSHEAQWYHPSTPAEMPEGGETP